ncbi:PREDICTED: uncharacterized protein LOC106315069 [Brassica oleracea var. oleracea]|uniref:uncharacterized protein LOC106315069 n=1 Tax=Brassica oleracea var. oleracea TaxID=109376 RepID=UPI0006A6B8CC|nr:PREDICTED: uncharacterized protein LOC106315069 [Brassica oleracea var. oleracea]
MLQDDNGTEFFSEGAKGNLDAEYFTNLFMSSNPHDLESLLDRFEGRVSLEMNEMLTKPVSQEEIRVAAFNVRGSSAPGEDGLTGTFYKKFWHVVGPSVVAEVQSFFNYAVLLAGWNHTHLYLLPKIQKPTKMSDMRPISLCSVQYKIVSKILCQRLKSVMPDIISETQGAFVSGRLISDNILVAHEMVHGLRTNEAIGKQYMAIKTDMSKAYDRVEWQFLEALLEKIGVNRRWVNWVMSCVSTVSYTVLLNGQTHGFIKPERGIRQGDPMSPFLLILCTEALVHALNMAEKKGDLHGIRLGRQGPAVHHLLFADDSLLMCKASKEESLVIIDCLRRYGEASGQVINKLKSSVIFGAKVSEQDRAEIKRILEIDKEGGGGTYLGLPECFQGSKVELLNFIREKLHGRLNGWYAKALSQGGKEILLKSIALALPVYAMSVFKLPKDLCDRLTSAMIEYWWSGGFNRKKISWVAWQKLCKSKDESGLGFHDISRFNQSLLAKQAWRILIYPESLVAKVLKSKYWKNGEFMECGLSLRPSFAWRSILHGRELLEKGLLRRVGDGSTTYAWTENWIMGPLPRPPLYRMDAQVDLTLMVPDLLIPNSNLWEASKIRSLFVEEDANTILNMTVERHKPAALMWGLTSHGAYSSQSGYKLTETLTSLNSSHHHGLPSVEKMLWKSIWKLQTSPKIRHVVWRALAGALAVSDQLRSRGLQVDTTCKSCGMGRETICHTLFSCSTARDVWSAANLPLPPRGLSTTSVFLNLHHLVACTRSRDITVKLKRSIPWLLWHIWKARNGLMFEKIRLSPSSIVNKAEEEAESWFNANFPEENMIQYQTLYNHQRIVWQAPPPGMLKCNIGVSWVSGSVNCGVSWITRDTRGKVLMHSRRSYSMVQSREEAELYAILWAIESMQTLRLDNIIFKTSFTHARRCLYRWDGQVCAPESYRILNIINSKLQLISAWSLDYVLPASNSIASRIAVSVTSNHLYQSYIARSGPSWLHQAIGEET